RELRRLQAPARHDRAGDREPRSRRQRRAPRDHRMTDDIERKDGPDPGEDALPPDAEFPDTDFRRLIDKLHIEHHFDFRDYKEASLRRRVRLRMSQVHAATVGDYITFLDQDPSEQRALIDTILINITRFFRDPEAWQVMRDVVLPRMVEHARATGGLRVWSAG